MALSSVLWILFSIIYTPFLTVILLVIFLASIGKSLGVRRLYIKLLLKLFEYGRQHIEIARKVKVSQSGGAVEEDCDGEGDSGRRRGEDVTRSESNGNNNKIKNGGSHLISREENLILVPDPDSGGGTVGDDRDKDKTNDDKKYSECNNSKPYDKDTSESIKREFELADCLSYVKTGVEAIIEDQVTSRFEAEELKSWNILTRTNHNYEFISWRLTFLWVIGFMVRYFMLFPLRVLICFFGVLWVVSTSFAVGFLPDGAFKRWISSQAFRITFRILTRSLSSVVTYHNVQYRPKCCGLCVSNHTSTLDVAILGTETCFSLTMWLTWCTAVVGYVPDGEFKRWLNKKVQIHCFGVLSTALSSVINYHNVENRPRKGICVANHTSPTDVLVLSCDNCYSLIGQRHGGFLGVLQRALARASPHIWFERSEVKDRSAVANRLREHISDPNNPPILIFPEGTCINNTSVMQFKKGSFEVGGTIYPVAIKYDPRFGDAFWNSSKYSMIQYLYCMMTSWAIVCDVWYLPPMVQRNGESSIDFANRVKRAIAEQGGLVDLVWDGQLKRSQVKKEWKEKQQEEFSKRLKIE